MISTIDVPPLRDRDHLISIAQSYFSKLIKRDIEKLGNPCTTG